MSFLEMYFRTKQQAAVIQILIIFMSVLLNYATDHWFTVVPILTAILYLVMAIWSFELAVTDIEIDQTPHKDRSPSQHRLQFVKISLDWSMVILETLTLILTAIAMVLENVSTSL